MFINEQFHKRLAELRTQADVSARDMSLSLGQSESYISNIENGHNLPSMSVFFYICDYLKVTPQEFFDLESRAPAGVLRPGVSRPRPPVRDHRQAQKAQPRAACPGIQAGRSNEVTKKIRDTKEAMPSVSRISVSRISFCSSVCKPGSVSVPGDR